MMLIILALFLSRTIRPYYDRSTTVYTTVIRTSICRLYPLSPYPLSGRTADSVLSEVRHG